MTACILGGIIAGFGSELTLRNGGSAGGTDILGMYFAKKYPDFSVGKIQNIILNGLKRGATRWVGSGCYNKTETYIYMTIISKY